VSTIEIAGRRIGGEGRCFIIAEAGVNHNGDVALAERLVDVAADAGADAVKFQTFDPQLLAAPHAERADYQVATTGKSGSQLEMLEALVLSRDAHARLQARARARGIIFFSTPFDEGSADFLETLAVPAYKISSGDLTNLPFLTHVARKGAPLLLSTGMATMAEVAAAVETVRAAGNAQLALFHCVSNYPTAAADCNLRAMASIRSAFDVPTGWSDHTQGIDISIAAVAVGAQLLEKHFTLDRNLEGPDHRASLEPDELRALVAGVRRVETALGDGFKAPRPLERPIAAIGRKSLHYRNALPAGVVITGEHLVALRPGTGISPADVQTVLGRTLARAVGARQQVERAHFEAGAQ
jgi:N-acetylneuraminate synthase